MVTMIVTLSRARPSISCQKLRRETGSTLPVGSSRKTISGRCSRAQPRASRCFQPAGSEPVREWLKGLDEAERQAIGKDLLRAQWRWPVGMPLCRPLGNGLWEVRTDLPTRRTARVLLCLYQEHLVALHGFIKKTRATPDEDLATARKRQKELER